MTWCGFIVVELRHIDGNTEKTPEEFLEYARQKIEAPGRYLVYRNFAGSRLIPARPIADEVTDYFIRRKALKGASEEDTYIILMEQMVGPAKRIGTLFRFFPIFLEEVRYNPPAEFATTKEIADMGIDRPTVDQKLSNKLKAVIGNRREIYLMVSGDSSYTFPEKPWQSLSQALEEMQGACWAFIEAYDSPGYE